MSSADVVKAQLKPLMDQRGALEAEIARRSSRLEAAGVGMDGALVDPEGYPRADMDVAVIRGDRHAVITLTNDHKALTRQMEALLHQLHGLSNDPGSSTAAAPAVPAAVPMLQQPAAPMNGNPMANGSGSHAPAPAVAPPPPFAVVDAVTAGSPAAVAGLQLGDQMCSFAGVTRQAPNTLQVVATALQANEGRAVEAVVLRHGAPVTLVLTPHQWSGHGLLGCHLRPL